MEGRQAAVLIMGLMRAGKTTTAGYLGDKYGFRRYALADSLKQLHTAMTGSLDKDREWLQKSGSAHRLVFGEDFWVEQLINQVEREKPNLLVVDDVRYENELFCLAEYAVKKYNYVRLVFVKVSMSKQIQRGAEVSSMTHDSELMALRLQNAIHTDKDGVEYIDLIKDADQSKPPVYIPVLDGNASLDAFYRQIDALDLIGERPTKGFVQSYDAGSYTAPDYPNDWEGWIE